MIAVIAPAALTQTKAKRKNNFRKVFRPSLLRLGAEKNEYKIGVLMDLVICGISAAAYVVATGYVKRKLIKLAKVKNND